MHGFLGVGARAELTGGDGVAQHRALDSTIAARARIAASLASNEGTGRQKSS